MYGGCRAVGSDQWLPLSGLLLEDRPLSNGIIAIGYDHVVRRSAADSHFYESIACVPKREGKWDVVAS